LACLETNVFAVRPVKLWTRTEARGPVKEGGWRAGRAFFDLVLTSCAGRFASQTLLYFNGVKLDWIDWTTLQTLTFNKIVIRITSNTVDRRSATFAIARTLLTTHCGSISKIPVFTCFYTGSCGRHKRKPKWLNAWVANGWSFTALGARLIAWWTLKV